MTDWLQDITWRVIKLMAINMLIGLAIALFMSWMASRSGRDVLSLEIQTSLIHASIYGLSFGLFASFLAERFEWLPAFWRWSSALLAIVLIAIAATFVIQMILQTFHYETAENEFWYKAATVSLIAVIVGISVRGYESVRTQIQTAKLQLRTQQLERERTLKLLSEARLASLESRLHPHFLFNTLNSISALIVEDPAVADAMVQRLARLLRASLDACEQDRVSLQQELDLTTDYLSIEQTRFRERLSYRVDVPTELSQVSVPPIVLQPLVENSVKFAIAPRPEGGSIAIFARRDSHELELEVWDDGPGFTMDMIQAGHGLETLQSRLQVALGPESKLEVLSKAGGTAVRLRLPINDVHS